MTSTPANPNFTSASLYVGDLQPDVTEALLFEFFNAVGPVASIRVCRDAVTRRSLGYGYVNFHNMIDAERALDTMNFSSIRGKPCRIMYSMRDPSLRKSGVGNIFVKNLDKSIDHKTLYDTFSMFGNILSCKVANNENGESLGYGFVHYASPDAAQKAIDKVNEMKIANRTVYVAKFVPKHQRTDSRQFTNIYVKNLPPGFSEKDLIDLFKEYGDIREDPRGKVDDEGNKIGKKLYVKICEGPQLGKNHIETQYGFVNFEKPESAKDAVQAMNGRMVNDHQLYVGRAMRRQERQRILSERQKKLRAERQKRYQGVNLYVKNIHDGINDTKLRELFEQFGEITSAVVMQDNENRSKGFGFVCFKTPDQATKAVTEMNSKIVEGKPLYVALAQRKEVRRQMLEQQFNQQQRGFNSNRGPGNMQGAGAYGQPQNYQFRNQFRPGFAGPMFTNQMPNTLNNLTPGGGMVRGGNMQRGNMVPNMAFPRQNRPRNQPTRGAGRRTGQQVQRQVASPTQVVTPQAYAVNSQVSNQLTTNSGAHLNPQELVNQDEATQKQMIGERIFPLIQEREPKLAGKITGMLLEMDNTELLNLLEDSNALESKILEAMEVLRAHTNAQSQTPVNRGTESMS